MAENTKIAWVRTINPDGTITKGHTFNPWIGCTKVSEGCANCYAETQNSRFKWVERWGKGAPRKRTSKKNWDKVLKWDKQAEATGIRTKVFCASLADVFDSEVPAKWRKDLGELIVNTPNLDWLVLTKRPENMYAMFVHDFEWTDVHGAGVYLPDNVWLGVTVENQEQADKRIPLLLQFHAKVSWLSCEPLLGELDLSYWLNGCPEQQGGNIDYVSRDMASDAGDLSMEGMILEQDVEWVQTCKKINWIIGGGESGENARPTHPDWMRSLRDQCVKTNTAYFVKQWGEWLPMYSADEADNYSGEMFEDEKGMRWVKVGKNLAGRLLDGREWNEYPE